jgi:hypothetical protein
MTTEDHFQSIQERIAPLRADLLDHPMYRHINSLESLRLFMQHHVFAVWDFMSLLKVLQRRLCCLDVPWLPLADHQAVRFINEIVLSEESDEDGEGGFTSHFDLYYRAMQRCGANTSRIDSFLDRLRSGSSVNSALVEAEVPVPIRQFVQHTFKVIEDGDLCAILSAFTFGREDLLPDVFQRIVDELNVETSGGLDAFKYYLSRHIQLDRDQHGPMAARLIISFCGNDEGKWRSAEHAAVSALRARKILWDEMRSAMQRGLKPGLS